MSTLLELTANIVKAHVGSTQMTSEQMLEELQKVHAALQALDSGETVEPAQNITALTIKQAFKKNEVICMVCGKGGFKTLRRHLNQVHGLKPGQYRKKFGIPNSQSLAAKSYSEARRKMAEERGLTDILAKARAAKTAKAKVVTPVKSTKKANK